MSDLPFVKHEYKQDNFGERKFNKKHKSTSGTLARDYLRQSPASSFKNTILYSLFVLVSKMRQEKKKLTNKADAFA